MSLELSYSWNLLNSLISLFFYDEGGEGLPENSPTKVEKFLIDDSLWQLYD